MEKAKRTTVRRSSALTREGIITAAIEILDTAGETGLTFQSLSKKLKTGPGALYWHISDKSDLLAAACDAVIAPKLEIQSVGATPQKIVRDIAGALFDTIDRHPWVGAALIRLPGKMPMVRVLECLGQQVGALNVPENDQWILVSTLLMYILGVAGQNAANAQLAQELALERSHFLNEVSTAWSKLPMTGFAFTRSMAARLQNHNDREDFLSGVDIILRGAKFA
ncbi:TetR/AcrR family transcriptional regulator [Rhizobium sp. HT1-10]|uniref:TetR/AcrR family transcriptional regulator n=1 Tax=Rhizobium sp. HT1-10 TaxID=3111638 RepID=UPI003C29262F